MYKLLFRYQIADSLFFWKCTKIVKTIDKQLVKSKIVSYSCEEYFVTFFSGRYLAGRAFITRFF